MLNVMNCLGSEYPLSASSMETHHFCVSIQWVFNLILFFVDYSSFIKFYQKNDLEKREIVNESNDFEAEERKSAWHLPIRIKVKVIKMGWINVFSLSYVKICYLFSGFSELYNNYIEFIYLLSTKTRKLCLISFSW